MSYVSNATLQNIKDAYSELPLSHHVSNLSVTSGAGRRNLIKFGRLFDAAALISCAINSPGSVRDLLDPLTSSGFHTCTLAQKHGIFAPTDVCPYGHIISGPLLSPLKGERYYCDSLMHTRAGSIGKPSHARYDILHGQTRAIYASVVSRDNPAVANAFATWWWFTQSVYLLPPYRSLSGERVLSGAKYTAVSRLVVALSGIYRGAK